MFTNYEVTAEVERFWRTLITLKMSEGTKQSQIIKIEKKCKTTLDVLTNKEAELLRA